MKKQQGFTLIELMIVVAIIAILAAIALPAYRDYTIKSKVTNAIGGLAGEKIKVGENFGAGANPATQAQICNGVATGLCAANGILTGRNTAGTGSVATTGWVEVRLTPAFPATTTDRILWTCAAVAADAGITLTTSNTPADCPPGA